MEFALSDLRLRLTRLHGQRFAGMLRNPSTAQSQGRSSPNTGRQQAVHEIRFAYFATFRVIHFKRGTA
jgi:hypothetical protein